MSGGRDTDAVCRRSINGNDPPSHAVIDCISEVASGDSETRPPLYTAIDPEALNNLFRDRTNGEVTFTYLDYEITVNSDTVTTTRRREEQPMSVD